MKNCVRRRQGKTQFENKVVGNAVVWVGRSHSWYSDCHCTGHVGW